MLSRVVAGFVIMMFAVVVAGANFASAQSAALTLRVGEPTQVEFEGTPGTGAEWRFDSEAGFNADRIDVEALGYGEPLNDRIGGPAMFGFRLSPLAQGIVRLDFEYGRSWEDEPWDRRSLWVYVRPARP